MGFWLAGGTGWRCFLPTHSLAGTRQPTAIEYVSIYLFILMESKLFNGGFTCTAPEDFAKYVVWGRAGGPHVAKSVNQTHSPMVYPAGTEAR